MDPVHKAMQLVKKAIWHTMRFDFKKKKTITFAVNFHSFLSYPSSGICFNFIPAIIYNILINLQNIDKFAIISIV